MSPGKVCELKEVREILHASVFSSVQGADDCILFVCFCHLTSEHPPPLPPPPFAVVPLPMWESLWKPKGATRHEWLWQNETPCASRRFLKYHLPGVPPLPFLLTP